MQNNLLAKVVTCAVFLSFLVVMLGAYTRLTDAGLGCPDWPGCYGQMVLPGAKEQLRAVQTQFPEIPIEAQKAWTEMIHRYAAGTLALLLFFIGFSVLAQRIKGQSVPWHLPFALLLLVIFQAALGMWTVTLKLLPVVVMGHLLGGMLIVACLCRFRLQISQTVGEEMPWWRLWLRIAVILVFLQIALGGWVSSNYAGISCIGFPLCNGTLVPELHFAQGFNLFSPVGANYQGGVLDHEVRVTIQWIHRLGAVLTASYVLALSCLILLKTRFRPFRLCALLMLFLVLVQFILGIINVLYLLPVFVAVAHNGIAALLLATVFSTLHFTRKGYSHAS